MDLLCFENGDKVIVCTYDNHIQVKLVLLNQKEIILYDDTKLSFVSLYRNYFADEKRMILEEGLENINLGILLNKYYYKIANDINLGEEFSCVNVNGDWVGTRYCCFENDNIATWIYLKHNQFIFECTPLYEGLFDDCVISFEEFMKSYKGYKNTFDYSLYRKFAIVINGLILSF